MSTEATRRYKVTDWDETRFDALDEVRQLSRTRITNTFEGDIEGQGVADYVITYNGGTNANFVGLQQVVGRLAGRTGSFVLQTSGTFAVGVTRAEWFVVPESATGELAGLSGRGGFSAPEGTTCDVELVFDLN
ncbi:DUF3224 domain-containing protein [Actinoplanes sp. HUAS TT8]|uniref:DUF3224 domain-containing protein n=1 Tax=Actinoplanes sp. HUAS TT8 TaxID=3447453 RepID=UPI003F51D8F5